MNWLTRLFGFDRATKAGRDLEEAKAVHARRVQHADYVLGEAFRKADAILRPYAGPERRRNPR